MSNAKTTSRDVLNIEKGAAAAFVKQQIDDRMLHETVAQLNKEVLFGAPTERVDAQRALARLGFADS